MKQLTISVDYSSRSDFDNNPSAGSLLALPLRVLDSEGGLIAEAVGSKAHPAQISIPDGYDFVFVRLTWPSGKTQTQKVDLNTREVAEARFTDQSIGGTGWAAWATPRLGRRNTQPIAGSPSDRNDMQHYSRVWLRLWNFANSEWTEWPVNPKATYGSTAAKQLDFELASGSWCLQLGGTSVPWRFVSLPGGGLCRVLLTPQDTTDPRADPLRVVVTSLRADAETLLEFLSRDSLQAAKSLAAFQPLAVRLLAEKSQDPIAAVAGAYFLLRAESWERIPPQWFDNLNALFPWIPDAAIIFCVVKIRRGLITESDEVDARTLLAESVARGLPIFSEGLSLLKEAASLLRRNDNFQTDGIFRSVERLVASRAWAGAVLSFYGERPNLPSPDKIVGYPFKGRLQKRNRARDAIESDEVRNVRPGSPTTGPRPRGMAEISTGTRQRSFETRSAERISRDRSRSHISLTERVSAKSTSQKLFMLGDIPS